MTLSISERNALVTENMGLVWHFAIKFAKRNPCVDLDDAIQEGAIALMRAADLFDPTLGPTFATYAYSSILRAVIHCRDTYPVVSGMGQRSTSRVRTDTEQKRQRAFRTHTSLNEPATKSDGQEPKSERIDFLKSDLPDQEERYAEAELAHHARRLVAKLPKRTADILSRRLAGESGAEVGASWGITKQRVDQIEREAIDKLKEDPWVKKTIRTGGP